MSEQSITYFGYGSLVNRDTRPINEQSALATLYGWGRVWGHRVAPTISSAYPDGLGCCSLSVERLSDFDGPKQHQPFIRGVVVTMPASELDSLNEREAGYDRVEVPAAHFDLPAHVQAEKILVYVSSSQHQGSATPQYPILQSYIDCVLAGYKQQYSAIGVYEFMHSTKGWEGVIEPDRERPHYPRAVSLEQHHLDEIDTIVQQRRLRTES
jgi:cation transport regulator ChaC